MKKLLVFLLCFSVVCRSIHLNASDTIDTIFGDERYDEEYSYKLSDNAQKRQAVGMIAWGFVMFAFTALLAGFVPHSQSPNPESAHSTTSGTGLF